MKTSIVVAGLLLFFGCTFKPQAQVPGPVFQQCGGGGLLYVQPLAAGANPVYRCIDPSTVGQPSIPTPPLTGGPCAPPATGVTIYVKLPDNTCLPLTAIPAPGGIAQILQYEFATPNPSGVLAKTVVTAAINVIPAK